MKNRSGWIIAAAFIGPGTVTTASIAGAQTGMHLAWALIFSIIATTILQDMIVQLSAATRKPLSENIMAICPKPWMKGVMSLLIFVAIGFGNAAYQSGNITGAAIGLTSTAGWQTGYWSILLAGVASLMLFSGSYLWVERILVGMVACMSLFFFITLLVSTPDWVLLTDQITKPFFSPSLLNLILALIGTTIVPYNLFLHASLVIQQKADTALEQDIKQIRKDSAIAILVGGTISLTIMATASIAFYQTQTSIDAKNIGQQLSPILGNHASLFFGMGLFAAGLTSAITAPLAAGYAVTSLMGWGTSIQSLKFKLIALTIILIGIIFTTVGIKPLSLIVLAQGTNAILLPLIIVIVIIVMHRHPALFHLKNKRIHSSIGMLITLLLIMLSVYKLTSFF